MPSLFDPITIGAIEAPNRIFMAPLTRTRATPAHVPTELMIEYYRQRAGAGLIISEATGISRQGLGWPSAPGLWTDEQTEAWKPVTEAVHKAGGRIVAQLWHMGRLARPDVTGLQSVSSSATRAPYHDPDKNPYDTARPLTVDEIAATLDDYASASRNAIRAGFDGVQVHGANGYLIDQFLRRTANQRTDEYGGSLSNRIRFAQEVLTAIGDAIGRERTGIRLSPFITQRGMNDPQVIDAILALAAWCEQQGIAFIHLAEADWDDAPAVPLHFRDTLRATFSGTLIVAGNYDQQKAERILGAGLADLVAFGRPFIANPDLPQRLQHRWPLATVSDPGTLFGGTAAGYTDYPFYTEHKE